MTRSLALLTMILAAGPGARAAAPTDFYDFVGEALVENERQAILAALSSTSPFGRVPLMVIKGDIDGDGEPDMVVFQSNAIRVFFKRSGSYEHHATGVRAGITAWQVESSQLRVLPGLKGRKEILVKMGDDCYVAYTRLGRLKSSGTLLENERFSCKDPEAQERYWRTRDECVAAGGEWGPHGLSRYGGCVRPMPDAGKPCSGKSDCQGRCVATRPRAPMGAPATGQCSETDQFFGCFDTVNDGKYVGAVCVD